MRPRFQYMVMDGMAWHDLEDALVMDVLDAHESDQAAMKEARAHWADMGTVLVRFSLNGNRATDPVIVGGIE